jgi:peptidoglycan/xylan/chitin deacetylase (PgdA/CDA1 family)
MVFLPVEFIDAGVSEGAINESSQTGFLSWDQVREMNCNGIGFGSHTLTHASLTELTRHDAQYQLERSKAKLEMEIGQPVTGFAYPYGTFRDFNPEMERLVATAGYSWAVTGISGVNNHKSNPFAFRRTVVRKDDNIYAFKRMMRGALDPWIVMQRLGRFL